MRTLIFSARSDVRPGGRAGRLALFLVATSALTPGVARAELARLVWEGADQLTCRTIQPCDNPGGSCDGTGGTELPGDTCETLPDGTLGCAKQGTLFLDEAFCCTSSADCGSADGHTGMCLTSANIDGWGLCDYGLTDYLAYCDNVDQTTISNILMCLQAEPSGSVMDDFRAGDCDGDGVVNAIDACVCDAQNACLLPPDGGIDAGAGKRGLSFTGEGGCAMAPAASSSLPTLMWLTALGLAFVRRRR